MPNPICHFEMGCRDRAKTKGIFQRTVRLEDGRRRSGDVHRNRTEVGGHITALGHEPHNYTIFYVKVDDVKAHLEKASTLGGKNAGGTNRDSNRHLRLVRRPRGQHDRIVAGQSMTA